ncbi:hypothetical protein THAOC_13326 [Thalassiosira oceanica]|uniref:Uncharacterized protein n=1 Tax=Thalassiosira oceanica TaxID=159749 RepID=K0SHZ9_THAOC|nr:hypothetical protein THAOC_13326 [Thalassiosira oceanica]|eukprot:EJK65783.1 hypothetical protein THAOC_13326 [Thalassiosira oceanica]
MIGDSEDSSIQCRAVSSRRNCVASFCRRRARWLPLRPNDWLDFGKILLRRYYVAAACFLASRRVPRKHYCLKRIEREKCCGTGSSSTR